MGGPSGRRPNGIMKGVVHLIPVYLGSEALFVLLLCPLRVVEAYHFEYGLLHLSGVSDVDIAEILRRGLHAIVPVASSLRLAGVRGF